MWCPKILSSGNLCKVPVQYLAENEEICGIVPYQKFSCYVTLATFAKMCGSQMGHMWITSGLFCRSVGQMGQQVRPTFNQLYNYYTYRELPLNTAVSSCSIEEFCIT